MTTTYVSSGQTVSEPAINGGDQEYVLSGGTTIDASDYGVQYVYGTTVVTQVYSFGRQIA